MTHKAYPLEGYYFYDNLLAIRPEELQELYSFSHWARSRSVEDIAKMLQHTDLCFSVRWQQQLVAFCRVLTDFTFRASVWDFIVHPDHQGRGLGTKLLNYALDHPVLCSIPVVMIYTTELQMFFAQAGFKSYEGEMLLLRRPLEYS